MPKYKISTSPKDLIAQEKLNAFRSRVNTLSKKTFGMDDCGGQMVEVLVIDRSRFRKMQYEPIRYDHKPMTPAEQEWNELALFLNLKMATSDVELWNGFRIRKQNSEGKK